MQTHKKPQILFEGKAQGDEKAERTRQYVSILNRLATQASDKIWGLKTHNVTDG